MLARLTEVEKFTYPECLIMSDPSELPPIENPYASPVSSEQVEKRKEASTPLVRRPLVLADPTRPLNPWLWMWTRPRATIRQIVDADPMYAVWPLAAFVGICQVSDIVGDVLVFSRGGWLQALLLMLVVGPLIGIVQNAMQGWLLNGVFQWFGGTGDLLQTRFAVAWGMLPYIAGCVVLIPWMWWLQKRLVAQGATAININAEMALATLIFLISLGWTCFTYYSTLGEVHGFSALKAFGVTSLAIVMFMGAIAMVAAIAIGGNMLMGGDPLLLNP